jgi:hypothetical protein
MTIWCGLNIPKIFLKDGTITGQKYFQPLNGYQSLLNFYFVLFVKIINNLKMIGPTYIHCLSN